MAKQRTSSQKREQPGGGGGSGKKIKKSKGSHTPGVAGSLLKSAVAFAVVGVCAYYGYRGYQETRVNSPFAAPAVVDRTGAGSSPARFWGSYRPGVYFGLKTRSPSDLLAGLMWMLPGKVAPSNLGLRHWCDQNDGLSRFGWTMHDGETFGVQEIVDRGVRLNTSFVKREGGAHGGEWTARISAEKVSSTSDTKQSKKRPEVISLFFYLGADENADGDLELWPGLDEASGAIDGVSGRSQGLGDFGVKFHPRGEGLIRNFFSVMDSPGPHKFTESVMSRLRMYDNKKVIGLDNRGAGPNMRSNLVVYQVNAELPFELDIVFESGSKDETDEELAGEAYGKALASRIKGFQDRFEKTFELRGKGYGDELVSFAQSAMSNMIGGIGYFFGHSLVQSELSASPVKYWEAALYTAVPSRSFFPRGFLWDEGFHNLLISKWSPEISADILGHWMDLLNSEGWIPREQILGLEARAKVPDEFVVQRNTNANPPTLLLTLHSMVRDMSGNNGTPPTWFREYLLRMWARLEKWYDWFNTTQMGQVPGTFRWRGRNGTTERELNPKTLTSGLDDFPRASHPTDEERHVDLRCWMALASRLMSDIGRIIGKDSASARYAETADFLQDNGILDAAHWSAEHKAYLDYGLHTERVVLERPRQNSPHAPRPEMSRRVLEEPVPQYVNQLGYVSLFPFLLQIVDPASPNLATILSDLEDPSKLWTPHGLRSLSRSASLYGKRNTEHDAPYWRGPIWINVNFLAVRALHHYAFVAKGPQAKEAERVYHKLRTAVVENVAKEYRRTGYVWEQYNDETGEGQGCRPFTGWSALVVLIMGEKY